MQQFTYTCDTIHGSAWWRKKKAGKDGVRTREWRMASWTSHVRLKAAALDHFATLPGKSLPPSSWETINFTNERLRPASRPTNAYGTDFSQCGYDIFAPNSWHWIIAPMSRVSVPSLKSIRSRLKYVWCRAVIMRLYQSTFTLLCAVHEIYVRINYTPRASPSWIQSISTLIRQK